MERVFSVTNLRLEYFVDVSTTDSVVIKTKVTIEMSTEVFIVKLVTKTHFHLCMEPTENT